MTNHWYCHWGKRLLDVSFTLLVLIPLFPLMALLSTLARFKFGSPILFCQQRPGLNGEPFTIYKFRTMTDPQITQIDAD